MSRLRISSLLGRSSILFIICCLVIVGLCINTAMALDGSGTEEYPWRIESLSDFDEFAADANYWDDYTGLEADVNLAGRTYTMAVIAPDINNVNNRFEGTAFTGIFNGNDHKILNLTIDDGGADNDCLGLFGYISDGEVRNLGIEDGSISGDEVVGGLVGFNGGSVSNCYSTADINGLYCVGGLVGNNKGIVSKCYSTGSVSGGTLVGGLCGNNNGTMSNCYSTGRVAGDNDIGGLVGDNRGGVSNCYSTGTVSGGGGSWIGGLCGDNSGIMNNCYSNGYVNGNGGVGGLVGRNDGGSISDCYSINDVDGWAFVGGLAGFNDDGTINNCYSTGDVNGDYYVGGLVGNRGVNITYSYWDIETSGEPNMCGLGNCDNSYGKTTVEMMQQSTFEGWDFVNVWGIGEKQTYPYLRRYLAGDINKDGIVNFKDFAVIALEWLEEE